MGTNALLSVATKAYKIQENRRHYRLRRKNMDNENTTRKSQNAGFEIGHTRSHIHQFTIKYIIIKNINRIQTHLMMFIDLRKGI